MTVRLGVKLPVDDVKSRNLLPWPKDLQWPLAAAYGPGQTRNATYRCDWLRSGHVSDCGLTDHVDSARAATLILLAKITRTRDRIYSFSGVKLIAEEDIVAGEKRRPKWTLSICRRRETGTRAF